MNEAITEDIARRLLPHTWHAFFGRFGRLTSTQAAAIKPIVGGNSIVLCAPTASGKTEALIAPIMERLIQKNRKLTGPRVLVICPTRALCNDLHRRIHRPVSQCGWTCDIKTGDSPSFSAQDPPDIVVTTPESFDSLLSRRPASLKRVGALFLDELHLLDGDPRGDHLRALVYRLKSFRKDLQVCAASATAADAERLAAEYGGPTAQVVNAQGDRDRLLDARLVESVTLEDTALLIRGMLEEEPGVKVLVFANTRAEVEWFASDLSDQRSFAHHGSLSKAERLRTEEGFLNAPSGICVATMTLELGVDIGDVDRVVLINPPPNVASFSQRIGRSNRRGGRIQATCVYSTPFDRSRFEHMIECAKDGRLFPERVAFRPTMLPQQATSLIFQNPKGWVSAAALHGRLPQAVQKIWTKRDCTEILEMMRKEGYLHADSHGRYVADEEAEQDYHYGRMHAHIASDGEIEVVDEATGRTIGKAKWSGADQTRSEAAGTGMLLGGKHRQVTRVRDGQVFVEGGADEQDAQFLSRMGPRYSFGLARDLARFLGYPDDELTLEPRGGKKWRVEHYFGTLWGKMLVAVLRERGFRVKKVTAFFAEAKKSSGKLPKTFGSAEEIEELVRQWLGDGKGYRQLLKPLQAGPWMKFVPDDMLRRWVVECVRPDLFAEKLSRFHIVEGDYG